MSTRDTQWPRFQVFHQERPDAPHINAGTVHAPDVEFALQNARDVFGRRPDCSSLWAVRADQITSLTADELGAEDRPEAKPESSDLEDYLVFVKRTHVGSHEYAGQVEAGSPLVALEQAIESQPRGLVWWVVPERSVARTEADEAASLFDPAKGKLYRDQAFYHTTTLMRKLREKVSR